MTKNKEQTLAMDILADLKANNKRLFIANIILTIALLLAIIF
jgi:hypothetical protein